MEVGVATKRGGACGGCLNFVGAILDVVTVLTFGNVDEVDTEGKTCCTSAVSRDDTENRGARMMEMLRTSSDKESKTRRVRVAGRDWCIKLDVLSWRLAEVRYYCIRRTE